MAQHSREKQASVVTVRLWVGGGTNSSFAASSSGKPSQTGHHGTGYAFTKAFTTSLSLHNQYQNDATQPSPQCQPRPRLRCRMKPSS